MKATCALLAAVAFGSTLATPAAARPQWSKAQANSWYDRQPWLVGANYTPANAINQLEMWQADTFDPARIDRELGWAEAIGMNTMRVFLHDALWDQDAEGFKRRIDQFLTIAAKHRIRPMLVLFDSVWDPNPKLGPQHPPIPGVHNSGWVQGPGWTKLQDRSSYPKLKQYVTDIVTTFAKDERVLAWDVWNEPDNGGGGNYAEQKGKTALVEALLDDVFDWTRAADPIQPVTAGVWIHDDWSPGKTSSIEALQLRESDVITFHDYNWPEVFERRVNQLIPYGRPVICTEFMARGNGSTFDGSLPVAKRYNVGVYNWGLVDGRTQTRFPWDSWQKPYTASEPQIWFHEVFKADGAPYRQAEVDLIRRLAAAPKGVVPPPQEPTPVLTRRSRRR